MQALVGLGHDGLHHGWMVVAEHEGAVFPSPRMARREAPLHVEDAWSPAASALVPSELVRGLYGSAITMSVSREPWTTREKMSRA